MFGILVEIEAHIHPDILQISDENHETRFQLTADGRPTKGNLGSVLIKINQLTRIGIPIVEIRKSWDRLISMMGIPKLVRWHLYTETEIWLPKCLIIEEYISPKVPQELF